MIRGWVSKTFLVLSLEDLELTPGALPWAAWAWLQVRVAWSESFDIFGFMSPAKKRNQGNEIWKIATTRITGKENHGETYWGIWVPQLS